MPIRINLKTVAVFLLYGIALLCINYAVKGIPLSIGLCFALMICGGNLVASVCLYILAGAINANLLFSLFNIFEGVFLCAVTVIYRKTKRKIKAEAIAYLCIALVPFVAFSSWQGLDVLTATGIEFLTNGYIVRTIASVVIIIFSFFCFRCISSLIFRLYRCRLRPDELVCISAVFVVCGIGLYNLIGLFGYLCFAVCVVALAIRLFKSPTAVIISCIIGIPCSIVSISLNYLTAIILLSVLTLLFCNAGRYAPSTICLVLFSVYCYFTKQFSVSVSLAILKIVLVIVACVIPIIPTDQWLNEQFEMITIAPKVSTLIQEDFKYITCDKLFRMSEVFREIECAFKGMDSDIDVTALKGRMFDELKDKCCSACDRAKKCKVTSVYAGFKKLIESGCARGKVSLVDLPADITLHCSNPTQLITVLNKLLADYRRYMLEADNMRSGRVLLANQAKGISEVLKGCATELSQKEIDHSRLANSIKNYLVSNGISCAELTITGDETLTIYVTTVSKVKISALTKMIEDCTKTRFILKDKVVCNDKKTCLIFTNPTAYDAVFGVAVKIKDGEKSSGDTHSVIKITEHSFLMALSDGMGSGESAKKVSTTTISLIEAFYRAQMPTETILDTINKLICFNRDERFTCIDIASIDLNSLVANFIKIGSPSGVIFRQGELKVLESHSLPLGILDSLHPTVCTEQLNCDDIIVFMSDGITSAFPSNTELYEFLAKLQPLNPQSLAETILDTALEQTKVAQDDMTVLCTRIFKRQ